MKRFAIATAVLAGLLTAGFAVGTHADAFVFISPIVGSNPGLSIAGVASGGAPWTVRHGVVVLDDNGGLNADVRGLLLPSTGTTGPVTQVAAVVACTGATGPAVAATSKSVNLSSKGNAKIHDKVTVPSPCFAPTILIRASGINNTPTAAGPFIALTGTAKDANDNDAQDNDNNDGHGHELNDN